MNHQEVVYWICFLQLFTHINAELPKLMPELTWTYDLISVETTSSDETLMKIQAQIVRIKRGEFALSAKLYWNYDVGNDTYIEYSAYRSATGSSDYKLLPYGMPRTEFYKYINTFYKNVLLKNLAECSDLPRFEGKFQPPWPQKTYTFDKCRPQAEDMPTILPEGYYKVLVNCSGSKVNWTMSFLVRLSSAIF